MPVEQRIGPEGGAWRLMAEALADERHVQFPPRRLRRDLEDVAAWLHARGPHRRADVRRRLAALAVEVRAVEMLALRVRRGGGEGAAAAPSRRPPTRWRTPSARSGSREAALALGGSTALAADAPVEFLWRQSLWETIGGGTSEVMRGVVARQALGLGGRG